MNDFYERVFIIFYDNATQCSTWGNYEQWSQTHDVAVMCGAKTVIQSICHIILYVIVFFGTGRHDACMCGIFCHLTRSQKLYQIRINNTKERYRKSSHANVDKLRPHAYCWHCWTLVLHANMWNLKTPKVLGVYNYVHLLEKKYKITHVLI